MGECVSARLALLACLLGSLCIIAVGARYYPEPEHDEFYDDYDEEDVSYALEAQRWSEKSKHCDLEQYVEDGETYAFSSFPPRHPQNYGPPPPRPPPPMRPYGGPGQYGYGGGEGYRSQDSPKRCTWRFETNDNCTLTFHTTDYDRGYINDCYQQYVKISGGHLSRKVCGIRYPPRVFTSSDNQLILKHYQRSEYEYRSSYITGYVHCGKPETGTKHNSSYAHGDGDYGSSYDDHERHEDHKRYEDHERHDDHERYDDGGDHSEGKHDYAHEYEYDKGERPGDVDEVGEVEVTEERGEAVGVKVEEVERDERATLINSLSSNTGPSAQTFKEERENDEAVHVESLHHTSGVEFDNKAEEGVFVEEEEERAVDTETEADKVVLGEQDEERAADMETEGENGENDEERAADTEIEAENGVFREKEEERAADMETEVEKGENDEERAADTEIEAENGVFGENDEERAADMETEVENGENDEERAADTEIEAENGVFGENNEERAADAEAEAEKVVFGEQDEERAADMETEGENGVVGEEEERAADTEQIPEEEVRLTAKALATEDADGSQHGRKRSPIPVRVQ